MASLKSKFNLHTYAISADYWDVSKSGKVLEFCVTAQIENNPAHYRLGVIQIGQIIRRIEQFAHIKNATPQIQLFPNLAEDKLAATVFWPELLSSENITLPKNKKEVLPQQSTIQSIAKNYRLTLKKIDFQEGEISHKWVVCSSSNQPFIWLKLGQFIEQLFEAADAVPGGEPANTVEILEPGDQKLETNLYPQLALLTP